MKLHEDLADRLIAAHRDGVRVTPVAIELSRTHILAIQSRVSAALGPVAGFKVGAIVGRGPILAPIPAIYAVENGGRCEVFDRLGVELEVGFEILKPFPAGGLPARVQEFVRPRAVIELVDTRLDGAMADDAQLKFADFQINAGLVVGEGLANWDGSDFDTVAARLTANEETILDGPASVPGGSALSNLDLLVRHLGNHCGGLQVGQTVITGSLCGLPWFMAGTAIAGHIDGIGSVSVSLI